MKIFWLALLLSPLLQGCGLGILAFGMGASKAGTAQVMSAYTEYSIEMEKINLEREKAGLAIRPILSRDEWMQGIQDPEKERKKRDYVEGEHGFVP